MIFSHAGDYGDLIYQVVAMRIMGGGELVLHPHPRGRTRARMDEKHAAGIIPLLECQPYIHKVSWRETPPDGAVPIDGWRQTIYARMNCNLQQRALQYLGLEWPPDDEPWLTVPSPRHVADTVFHRSNRRFNPQFDWAGYINQHKASAVDIATAEDYRFDELTHCPCPTLLDVAQVIAGSKLFIGNQSCPLAIAEGLKHPLICEMHDPDSVPFRREFAQYGPPAPIVAPLPRIAMVRRQPRRMFRHRGR